jgi:lysylphosphatidylglycerol synthetase-like protein (DUF2156 family)
MLLSSLTPSTSALLQYAETHHFMVIAGNPPCPAPNYGAFTQALEQEHALRNRRICFFGTDEAFALACGHDYCHALIGSEPRWNLAHWHDRQAANKPVRNSLNAALRLGCTVREVQNACAEAGILTACEHVRQQWLRAKHLPPLHFVAETNIVLNIALSGKRLFIVEAGGTVICYGIIGQIMNDSGEKSAEVRCEYRIEHFVRAPQAPSGAVEILIHYIAQTLASEGTHFLSLSLAPFSRKAASTLPHALRSPRMESYLYALARFGGYWYNAKGLEKFKCKFQPDEWKPLYCSFRRDDSPRKVLAALAEVFLGDRLLPSTAAIARRTIWTTLLRR